MVLIELGFAMIGTSTMQSPENMLNLHQLKSSIPSTTTNRILDIPCKVCGDFSSGKHYNIFACDGCAGFFKRSVRRNRQYVCVAKPEGRCLVDKKHRNHCRACRLNKCQEVGMNKDAVQHERGPRNATLRRQLSLYFHDPRMFLPSPPGAHILDLAMPKAGSSPPHHLDSMLPTNAFMCNPASLAAATSSHQNLQHHQHQLHHHAPVMVPSPPMPVPPAAPAPAAPAATAATPLMPIFMPVAVAPAPGAPGAPTTTICETAAQLLFMNVKWTKSVPRFTQLPIADQLLLLAESWRELFIISAAQFQVPLELGALVQASGMHMRHPPERFLGFLQQVKAFQELLARMAHLNLDAQEYACLRAIVLFKTNFDGAPHQLHQRRSGSPIVSSSTSDSHSTPSGSSSDHGDRKLVDVESVAEVRESTQLILNKYLATAQPHQPLRFGKLLLLLPQLRDISADTIEELFFRSTIGSIPIVRIISDMYVAPSTL